MTSAIPAPMIASAQGVVVGERFRAGDPLAGAVAGGDAAVEGLRDVQGDERPLGLNGVEPLPVQLQGGLCAEPGADADSRGTQRRSAAGGGIVRIVDRVDDVSDTGLDDRLGAGPGASAMVARLQRDHHGGAAEVVAGGLCLVNRIGFRVGGAGAAVVARDQAGSVSGDHDGADQRVHATGPLQGCLEGGVHGSDLDCAETGNGNGRGVVRRLVGGVLLVDGVSKAHQPATGLSKTSVWVKSHRRESMCVVPSL